MGNLSEFRSECRSAFQRALQPFRNAGCGIGSGAGRLKFRNNSVLDSDRASGNGSVVGSGWVLQQVLNVCGAGSGVGSSVRFRVL